MVKKEIYIFIQARINSSRYPKKIFKKIGKYVVLDLIKKRLDKSKFSKNIIFLIPKNDKNLPLKNFLLKRNYKFFMGNERNVLSRFYNASNFFKSKNIVRITSDCPFIDYKLLDNMIKKYFMGKYDYLSNIYPKRSFPNGLDIEIFNHKALSFAKLKAKKKYDIEHVTPYILKNKKFKKFNFLNRPDTSKLRITLDYKEDLENLNLIFKKLKNNYKFCYSDILKLFLKEPEIFNYEKNKI